MDFKQTHRYFAGHTGQVSISWHIVNNVSEMYDSSKHDGKWGELPALDGSLLYVWCDVHLTDSDMERRIALHRAYQMQISDDIYEVYL